MTLKGEAGSFLRKNNLQTVQAWNKIENLTSS